MKIHFNHTTKQLIALIKFLLGISLLLTLYMSIENKQGVLAAFQNANYVNLGVGALFILVNLLFQYMKYVLILQGAGFNLQHKEIMGSLFFGSLLAFVTPGSIGELGKGLYFNQLDKWKATGAVVADKLINMISTFLIGSVTFFILIYTKMGLPPYLAGLYLTFFVVSLLVLSLFLYDPLILFFVARRMKIPRKWQLRLFKTVRSLDAIPASALFKALGIGALWVLGLALQYHMVLLGFISLSFWDSLQVIPSMLMVKMALPITLGDLGIREGALLFFYGLFGVSNEAVIYTGLIIFIFNMSIPAIIGGFTLKHLKFGKNG